MDDFEKLLNEELKNPEFKKLWEENEILYVIAKNMIRCRNELQISQSELALKANVELAAVSEIEWIEDISILTLDKLVKALHTTVSALTTNN